MRDCREGGRPLGRQCTVDALLDGLNPEQERAVRMRSRALLVAAGAGTGKTRVLVCRVAFLISSGLVRPEAVLAITFTRRASREMTGRLRALCASDAAAIRIGTFHSVCARILRANPELIGRSQRFTIYDTADARRLIDRALTRKDRMLLSVSEAAREISLMKNHAIECRSYQQAAADERSRLLASVWRAYERELERGDGLDFDDLLAGTVRMLREHPRLLAQYQDRWRAILVDEYQDTNPVQARLLRLLVAGGEGERSLTVLGDPDQTIFGFRLSEPRQILRFCEEYPAAKQVRLQCNYRSSAQILQAANCLIAHNRERQAGSVAPVDRAAGSPAVHVQAHRDCGQEARWIARQISDALHAGANASRIAVLARYSSVLECIEHALLRANVAYRMLGGQGLFARREVRLLLCQLRLLVNPNDRAAFAGMLDAWPNIDMPSREGLTAFIERQEVDLLSACMLEEHLGTVCSPAAAHEIARLARQLRQLAVQADHGVPSRIVRCVIDLPDGPAATLELQQADRERRLGMLVHAAAAYERDQEHPSLADWLEQSMLAGDEEPGEEEQGAPCVTLATIHRVKGLEWETVIGAGMEDGIMPSSHATSRSLLEEERRMAYVLITRARRTLILSHARRRNGRPATPSPFIAEALTDTHPS